MKAFLELSPAGEQRVESLRPRPLRELPYGLLAIWLACHPARAEDFPNALTRPVEALVSQALRANPEIAAAYAERDAAAERIAPAGALDDPMLETGVVNAPLPFSLRRDDMTMTMLGLSQRLPFPGKRALRRDVAAADARSIASAAEEVANRVARDVRIAYADLQLAVASRDVVRETLATVRQLGEIAGHRYAVGQVPQSDVLRAQIEAVRLQQDLLRWEQAVSARRADLRRLVGGREDAGPLVPTAAHLLALSADPDQLFEQADVTRPSLKALEALITRSERALELAHRDYYPDFDVRLGYGLRERTLGGAPRDDMVTLTVAVNLPLWRKSRLDPRVAEAIAMRRQARSAAESQRLEIRSLLSQQIGAEQQLREAVILYRRTLRPQTQAAFEAAVAAYRVGRVDFLTLLDARVRVLETGLGEADAMAGQNKAVAEIQFLTGLTTSATALEGQLP